MSSIRDKLKQSKSKLATPREEIADHPADLRSYQSGGFYYIKIDMIEPNPYQPRKYFDPDRLAELSESIKKEGVLQPVLIRRDEKGQVYLVAGERRWRAARMAGLTRIPTILTTGNPVEIALIENLQRDNLRPIEEAEALQQMVEQYHYTQEQLALAIGKAQSTISEILSLNRLPEVIRDEIRSTDQYPRRVLIEISKQKTSEAMVNLFKKVKKGQLKSDQVREISRDRGPQSRRDQRSAVHLIRKDLSRLRKRLSELDPSSLSEKEKKELAGELQDLNQVIEKTTELL